MKERASWPMKAWEVRAILDGRKTQTRRVVRPQPGGRLFRGMDSRWYRSALADERNPIRCPYGVPGDRLWVREAWRVFGGREYEYQQDREAVIYREGAELVDSVQGPWRSPIHMPRWASRLTLEIVSVRVERVQEISREDEIAEGTPDGMFFDCLWDSINAKRAPWSSNPWVWVIEFRKAGE
jgi:hypothetical protein